MGVEPTTVRATSGCSTVELQPQLVDRESAILVILVRLERTAFALSGRCSNQLSYKIRGETRGRDGTRTRSNTVTGWRASFTLLDQNLLLRGTGSNGQPCA
jgi:hypothetical protein